MPTSCCLANAIPATASTCDQGSLGWKHPPIPAPAPIVGKLNCALTPMPIKHSTASNNPRLMALELEVDERLHLGALELEAELNQQDKTYSLHPEGGIDIPVLYLGELG